MDFSRAVHAHARGGRFFRQARHGEHFPGEGHQESRSRAQDAPEVIARRLANARDEIAHVTDFDYVIINSDFRAAAAELQDVVRAERLRTPRQLKRQAALINRLK